MLSLEEDDSIEQYEYEPLHIVCDNGHIYTPDIKINNTLIELKSLKYINSNEQIKNNFLYKKEQAEEYCKKHNLIYKVIYDKDIGFDSRRMKATLKNNKDIIEKYKIVFNDINRIVN